MDYVDRALFDVGVGAGVNVDAWERAWQQHPVNTLKALFYLRDIKRGSGRRLQFRSVLYKWLSLRHPDVLSANIHLIPVFGRWDDLFFVQGDLGIRYFANRLRQDRALLDLYGNNARISNAAKWAPTEHSKRHSLIVKLCVHLNIAVHDRKIMYKLYRTQYISPLRANISGNESGISSGAMSGTNISALDPHSILSCYAEKRFAYDWEIESKWRLQMLKIAETNPDLLHGSKCIFYGKRSSFISSALTLALIIESAHNNHSLCTKIHDIFNTKLEEKLDLNMIVMELINNTPAKTIYVLDFVGSVKFLTEDTIKIVNAQGFLLPNIVFAYTSSDIVVPKPKLQLDNYIVVTGFDQIMLQNICKHQWTTRSDFITNILCNEPRYRSIVVNSTESTESTKFRTGRTRCH